MMDFNGIKISPNIKLNFGKSGKNARGGDGGSIVILTEDINGSGKIIADGGDGQKGGAGGNINIIAEENRFRGEISAKGGKGYKNQGGK